MDRPTQSDLPKAEHLPAGTRGVHPQQESAKRFIGKTLHIRSTPPVSWLTYFMDA